MRRGESVLSMLEEGKNEVRQDRGVGTSSRKPPRTSDSFVPIAVREPLPSSSQESAAGAQWFYLATFRSFHRWDNTAKERLNKF